MAAIEAMGVLDGLQSDSRQREVMCITGAILLLGQIRFDESDAVDLAKVTNDDQTKIINEDVLSAVRDLLGLAGTIVSASGDLSHDRFKRLLVTKEVMLGRDMTTFSLSPAEARAASLNLGKELYERLFEWIVEQVNRSTPHVADGTRPFIGLLDIFGFENFTSNSLEQLCINYANEKLQAFFSERMIRVMSRQMSMDGILVEQPELQKGLKALDNDAQVKLVGEVIFPLLDSLLIVLERSENGKRTKAEQLWGGKSKSAPVDLDSEFQRKLFQPTSIDRMNRPPGTEKLVTEHGPCFVINHFVGEVKYSYSSLVKKNRGWRELSTRRCTLLLESSTLGILKGWSKGGEQIASLVSSAKDESMNLSSRRAEARATITASFRRSMDKLMATLTASQSHFVRCIKPNARMLAAREAGSFVGDLVQEQLKHNGTLMYIRILNEWYPIQKPLQEMKDTILGFQHSLPTDLVAQDASSFCKFVCEAALMSEGERKAEIQQMKTRRRSFGLLFGSQPQQATKRDTIAIGKTKCWLRPTMLDELRDNLQIEAIQRQIGLLYEQRKEQLQRAKLIRRRLLVMWIGLNFYLRVRRPYARRKAVQQKFRRRLRLIRVIMAWYSGAVQRVEKAQSSVPATLSVAKQRARSPSFIEPGVQRDYHHQLTPSVADDREALRRNAAQELRINLQEAHRRDKPDLAYIAGPDMRKFWQSGLVAPEEFENVIEEMRRTELDALLQEWREEAEVQLVAERRKAQQAEQRQQLEQLILRADLQALERQSQAASALLHTVLGGMRTKLVFLTAVARGHLARIRARDLREVARQRFLHHEQRTKIVLLQSLVRGWQFRMRFLVDEGERVSLATKARCEKLRAAKQEAEEKRAEAEQERALAVQERQRNEEEHKQLMSDWEKRLNLTKHDRDKRIAAAEATALEAREAAEQAARKEREECLRRVRKEIEHDQLVREAERKMEEADNKYREVCEMSREEKKRQQEEAEQKLKRSHEEYQRAYNAKRQEYDDEFKRMRAKAEADKARVLQKAEEAKQAELIHARTIMEQAQKEIEWERGNWEAEKVQLQQQAQKAQRSMPTNWAGRYANSKGFAVFPLAEVEKAALSQVLDVKDKHNLGIGKDVKDGPWKTQGGDKKLALANAWRIEHPHLWNRYTTARDGVTKEIKRLEGSGRHTPVLSTQLQPELKDFMERTNEETLISEINEVMLLHGTKPEMLMTILQQGVDEKWSKGLFGEGTSCAANHGPSHTCHSLGLRHSLGLDRHAVDRHLLRRSGLQERSVCHR